MLLLRRVEFELSAAGLRHRGTDNRNGLDPLPVVDRRKSRTRKRSLRQINRVEAKLPPVIVVPAHDVHRCLGIVDRRSAEDAVLRKVCVPAIEAELLWLRLAEPLRPDERVSRLRQCRFLVGVVRRVQRIQGYLPVPAADTVAAGQERERERAPRQRLQVPVGQQPLHHRAVEPERGRIPVRLEINELVGVVLPSKCASESERVFARPPFKTVRNTNIQDAMAISIRQHVNEVILILHL